MCFPPGGHAASKGKWGVIMIIWKVTTRRKKGKESRGKREVVMCVCCVLLG